MPKEGSSNLENNNNSCKSNGFNLPVKRKNGNVDLGDMVWVRLSRSSWWPAQVVDGKNLSKGNKPQKKTAGDVLVRLYGSYMYRYVDPVTCRPEFEKVLQKNDGNYHAILESSLQKDLGRLRSKSSKGNKSDSKGVVQANGEENNEEPATAPKGKSPELTARRVKVMQNLGLVPPVGSPYRRKGPLF